MADIFISYAREDRPRIEPLAHALEAQGWTVWWDRKFRPGENIEDRIRKELDVARCVIVAWSKSALKSPWVPDEARVGRDRGVLVPILLEAVSPPFGFGGFHAADLSDWRGQKSHTELDQFLKDVSDILPVRISPVSKSERSESRTYRSGDEIFEVSRVDLKKSDISEHKIKDLLYLFYFPVSHILFAVLNTSVLFIDLRPASQAIKLPVGMSIGLSGLFFAYSFLLELKYRKDKSRLSPAAFGSIAGLVIWLAIWLVGPLWLGRWKT